jgi:hypothetical protein
LHAADPDRAGSRASGQSASWDSGKIPLFAPDQPSGPEARLPLLQPKLAVGQVNDPLELEADRSAQQVMLTTPASTAVGGSPLSIQRISGQSNGQMDAAPASVDHVLASPGKPLEPGLRQDMEQRFGHDFSRVRVHSGTAAEQSARDVNANAYTVRHDIVFGAGRFTPGTHEGRRLIAHELTHVVQGAGQNAILRREPDPKVALAEEAKLRVRIVDALEATKRRAVDAVTSAIQRGDRAYLQGLGLSPKQVGDLLNHTPQFNMEFGTAVERQIEQSVRANPDISQYVKKGPSTVPRGVGKPDWIIETRSSSIPVELTTRAQLEEKLAMWRRQSHRGKPKWYLEKSVNLIFDVPSGLRPPQPPQTGLPAAAPGTATPAIAQVGTRTSGFRTMGRFLARETPGLVLQAVLMALFPPSVNIHNDKAKELSTTKLDPAVEDALAKQGPVFDKLLADNPSKSIYANVTARLDYAVDPTRRPGDLELSLKDITVLLVKITNENIALSDPKFTPTSSRNATKQITYSLLLYEPESVTRAKEQAREKEEAERRKREAEWRKMLEAEPVFQRGFKQ